SFCSVVRLSCKRSSKASPIATSCTFLSARSACDAAPVPRWPQPIRPTRIVSLPVAWTCGTAVSAPVTAAVLRNSRRLGVFGTAAPFRSLLLQRLQLELADVQLESLALKQNLAGGGERVVAMIYGRAVDLDRDRFSLAQAFDARPFAELAFDVVFPASVEKLLKVRVVERPPELPGGELAALAAFFPARPLVRPKDHIA